MNRFAFRACGHSLLLALASMPTLAVDFETQPKKWQLNASLERSKFEDSIEEMTGYNMRIVDYEVFRAGRVVTATAVWVARAPGEEWQHSIGTNFSDFRDAHEINERRGYSIVEVEIDRIGAGLQFAGVWLKGEDVKQTVLYYGMDDLMFSNRYGEMADRGYRLIDFEAYEANGKVTYAAIWMPKGDQEPRFYRGLDSHEFSNIESKLRSGGFRLLDIEVYETPDGLRYAAEWVRATPNQQAIFAFDLQPDDFYQRNAEYTERGYRLIEYESYELRSESRYAGSWVLEQQMEKQTDSRESFLDALRRSEAVKE